MVEKNEDIRWKQRFSNYTNAFEQLQDAVDLSRARELSMLEKQGLIQAFEYTHELAWNVMKDFLEYQGNQNVKGSRDAIREAFKVALIDDGETWMETIQTRNVTSHGYDKEMAEEVVNTIINDYMEIFSKFKKEMLLLLDREN
ncbi:MAG: nucleotidyltransferase substrate binding protein [Sulfuricurvum sp.]|jgi:nucleotidyltransferase substrate binding protein (TIGR01987 family)|uniref:nucleotidyltransferase substrate binding protein n=1 Tax=Sulfuricurvum sp. TaxID=2025608 RepID=UPI0025D8269E|nr:nucleotidyltransferase substrate binding protein [Sulfuricurvum sp.]MCK9373982.1 nucleotidyltransferase substrate binding protein [Sulfuricurvum sp.]